MSKTRRYPHVYDLLEPPNNGGFDPILEGWRQKLGSDHVRCGLKEWERFLCKLPPSFWAQLLDKARPLALKCALSGDWSQLSDMLHEAYHGYRLLDECEYDKIEFIETNGSAFIKGTKGNEVALVQVKTVEVKELRLLREKTIEAIENGLTQLRLHFQDAAFRRQVLVIVRWDSYNEVKADAEKEITGVEERYDGCKVQVYSRFGDTDLRRNAP